MKQSLLIVAIGIAIAGCSKESEKSPTTNTRNNGPAETTMPNERPDNTKVNQRDRSGDTPTPGDQGESAGDREITAQIRRAVVRDDSLGMVAKNVKIITRNGVVTLRGPVGSPSERAAIAAHARKVAGVQSVSDQLEIATN